MYVHRDEVKLERRTWAWLSLSVPPYPFQTGLLCSRSGTPLPNPKFPVPKRTKRAYRDVKAAKGHPSDGKLHPSSLSDDSSLPLQLIPGVSLRLQHLPTLPAHILLVHSGDAVEQVNKQASKQASKLTPKGPCPLPLCPCSRYRHHLVLLAEPAADACFASLTLPLVMTSIISFPPCMHSINDISPCR